MVTVTLKFWKRSPILRIYIAWSAWSISFFAVSYYIVLMVLKILPDSYLNLIWLSNYWSSLLWQTGGFAHLLYVVQAGFILVITWSSSHYMDQILQFNQYTFCSSGDGMQFQDELFFFSWFMLISMKLLHGIRQ